MLRSTMTRTALLLLASGCATSFTGSAEIEGGRPGCEAKCLAVGLTMQAYVFMGEYSTACVCAPKDATSGSSSAPTAATAAVAVGVMTQMRDAADQFCADTDCGRF
ncbi:MAG TPA: hypothetical protein VJV78_18425 [Polyangiales bacterium]|nr:hypothetical protein [Polyangiales bacterium]